MGCASLDVTGLALSCDKTELAIFCDVIEIACNPGVTMHPVSEHLKLTVYNFTLGL